MEAAGSNGIVDITTTSAFLFVVIASCFLILLYKLMSFWFVELLVVLFCIGGVEVQSFTFIPTSFCPSNCFLLKVLMQDNFLNVIYH